ncbi:MAG: hypothetical protein ACYTGT_20265 [Planctomycetota bacterium]|jgi:hypothetical protein
MPTARATVKHYDKWLVLLVVLWLVAHIPNPLISNLILSRLLSLESLGIMALNDGWAMVLTGLLRAIVAVAIAVWLYRTARRDGASPVVGALLYFVLRLYHGRLPAPICTNCRYDLRGTLLRGQTTCPECGQAAPAAWHLPKVSPPEGQPA